MHTPGDWLDILLWITLASAGYPLWRAWQALAGISLRHAALWTILACLTWLTVQPMALTGAPLWPAYYFALCMSACPIVAVLGARRPGMAAWNFVVLGLLAVSLMPLVQQPWTDAGWRLEGPWAILLGGIFLVGILNYLPTRLWPAALTVGLALLLELLFLLLAEWSGRGALARGAQAVMACGIWLGFLTRQRQPRSQFDSVWHTFRDRYGLVWAWRVQEQFNNAAAHAGWAARLRWSGLQFGKSQPPSDIELMEMLQTLQAILKRFGCEAKESNG